MKYYHAAPADTMDKISADGVIKKGYDGRVYLCKNPDDAAKFIAIRGCKNIEVIEVELRESQVKESFDHSESFFGCKAYYSDQNIDLYGGELIFTYDME